MIRPKCKRCGGPLDFWTGDEDDGGIHWICNNPGPLRTDEEHEKAWAELSGDEVARLERFTDD